MVSLSIDQTCRILTSAYALALFQRMAFASIEPFVSSEFNLTTTQVGDLSFAFFWGYFLAQIPAGVVSDMLGTKATAFGGTLIASVGSVLFLGAASFDGLVVSRVVTALGCAMTSAAMIRFACVNYVEKSDLRSARACFLVISAPFWPACHSLYYYACCLINRFGL